jgi:hypothetical protein
MNASVFGKNNSIAQPAAVIDAAVVYGAQRYFDEQYLDKADPDYKSPYWWIKEGRGQSEQYLKQNDRFLFIELMHDLVLYEILYLDNSSVGEKPSDDLLRFVAKIHELAGHGIFRIERLTGVYYDSPPMVQVSLCKYISEMIQRDPDAERRMSAVAVPWAYKSALHRDRGEFEKLFRALGTDDKWLPLAIFVWRGLMYFAFAMAKHSRFALHGRELVTYVASPGRMSGLRAILNAEDLVRYEWPREAWRNIMQALPGLPSDGFNFSFVSSFPSFETSVLGVHMWDMPALEATKYVCELRRKMEVRQLRDDWTDILFSDGPRCAVGSPSIQILKNMIVHGNVTQKQWLRASPRSPDET